MDELAELKVKVASLEATRMAHSLVLHALMLTHPRHADAQLLLTTLLEQQLPGALGQTLSEKQKEVVRETVEQMQRVGPLNEGALQAHLQRLTTPPMS